LLDFDAHGNLWLILT